MFVTKHRILKQLFLDFYYTFHYKQVTGKKQETLQKKNTISD